LIENNELKSFKPFPARKVRPCWKREPI
jgi:hypothetical protein